MNLKAIADGIAGRFVNVVATNGSSTETATATADLQNQAGKLVLWVWPPTGELSLGLGGVRNDTFEFPVRLLRDPLNVPERTQWLYAWFNALRDLVEADMDLGLSYVKWARVTEVNMGIDTFEYPDMTASVAKFDVVEFTVVVHVVEVVPTVGI